LLKDASAQQSIKFPWLERIYFKTILNSHLNFGQLGYTYYEILNQLLATSTTSVNYINYIHQLDQLHQLNQNDSDVKHKWWL